MGYYDDIPVPPPYLGPSDDVRNPDALAKLRERVKPGEREEQVWTQFMAAAISNAATMSMSPEWFGITADKFLDEWRKRWAAK